MHLADVPDVPSPLHFVIAGRSHTTYHHLLAGLAERGHSVVFLERRAAHAPPLPDLGLPASVSIGRYRTLADLRARFSSEVRAADVAIVGSHLQQGATLGIWVTKHARGVTAFHDLDSHETVESLDRGDCAYLTRPLVRRFHAYLASAGGSVQKRLANEHGARVHTVLPRWIETEATPTVDTGVRFDLGHAADSRDPRRATLLDRLLAEAARRWPAGRFAIAGELESALPPNITRMALAPDARTSFYASCGFVLDAGGSRGWTPPVSLLDALASGRPVITDEWHGLEQFFVPGKELLVARSPADTLGYLRTMTDQERSDIGARGRERALAEHTGARRAEQVESCALDLLASHTKRNPAAA